MTAFISDHAQGIAGAIFVLALYMAVAPTDAPTETDALQASAEVSNQLAAESASQNRALVAKE